jgi:hypothetical protein
LAKLNLNCSKFKKTEGINKNNQKAHLAITSDAVRISHLTTQQNEFKSTNVKLTSKNCSLTTMTIANRRCSFMSTILSLSPRHRTRNLESGNKSATNEDSKANQTKYVLFFIFEWYAPQLMLLCEIVKINFKFGIFLTF